eukprot:TRINITY_DN45001_c0_g1_i1.p1 TRINITY_DN45001_c0_g1~~TRINITY_DN45001_c0_g1_i1.p1  ORF type:complete len:149 (+),score=17.69 TRINITY_DN45001_c0_g1_i1:79-525(+)
MSFYTVPNQVQGAYAPIAQQYAPVQQVQQVQLQQFPQSQMLQQPATPGAVYAAPPVTTVSTVPVVQQTTNLVPSTSMIAYPPTPAFQSYPAGSAMFGPFKFTAEPQHSAGGGVQTGTSTAPVAPYKAAPSGPVKYAKAKRSNKKKGCC